MVMSAAVIIPSLLAPIFTLMKLPEVGPVASNISARPMEIFTGRRAFLESAAATGSR